MLQLNSHFYDIGFFDGIHHEKLRSLYKHVELRNYPAGSLIFRPQESFCENLFYLEKGKVEMYRITMEGQRLVIGQVQPGSIFGIRGLILGRDYQRNFAEAVEDSSISIITKQEFMSNLTNHPEIMQNIIEILCNRAYRLQERLLEVVCIPVRIRIANYLVTNSDRKTGTLKNFTHQEIGERIGAVRQTVTKYLNLMQKQGLISIKPRSIRIVDRPGLEKILLRKPLKRPHA
ncbi:MAG: Crp/Fnr family transcriptional regulator [Dehalococcoidia bacterium]|jgi:CRP/FNR family transcriptional regulator